MTDLASLFQATEQSASESQEALDDVVARQKGDDRSLIAKVIIWAFIGIVCFVVVAMMVGTFWVGWQQLSELGKFLMSILGSVMLPVVTLVIGYYFGNR